MRYKDETGFLRRHLVPDRWAPKGPGPLYRLPPSHTLQLTAPGDPVKQRKGPAAFIVQLFGYLFETRVEFHDWWFDGRVPIDRPRKIDPTEAVCGHFVSHCFRTWQGWSRQEKRLITNVLYMHCRAPSYEWPWERFAFEYMVNDGCYRLAELQGSVRPRLRQDERIPALCGKFRLAQNRNLIKEIVELRNGLFHETFWAGQQPGAGARRSAYYASAHLRRLNQRLIPALLGYQNQFVSTQWWSLTWFPFNAPETY